MTWTNAEETIPAPGVETDRMPEDPLVLGRGESLSRYVVLEQLGRGGMGVVYAAYDPELDRRVALKTLYGGDPLLLQREAQALARLSHPNVVTVHDVGTDRGRVFIAMELVDGTTLKHWMEDGDRDWRAVVDVFVAAGRGLAAAHGARLVHRDFKPTNVMMTAAGVPKVTDFGLARDVGRARELQGDPSGVMPVDLAMTKSGALVGTPMFMSPEQHGGRRATEASDQFSYCASLFRALYGEHPFESEDLPSLQAAVVMGNLRPPPPGSRVPARIGRIVERGLSLRPEDRFASMDALVEALVRARDQRQRQMVVAGSLLLVGSLVAAGASWALAPSPCEGAEVLEAWSPEAQARVQDAFAAVDGRYGQVAIERVLPRLDDYVDRLGGLRHEACVDASAGRTTVPPAELRVACLERRHDAASVVIEVMTEADEEVVVGASALVGQLPPLEVCSDPELASLEPQPTTSEDRAAVARLRLRLERARAAQASGELHDALEQLTALLEEAEAVGFVPLMAEVRMVRARTLKALGRYRETVEDAELVHVDASASALPVLAANAAATVATTYGEQLKDRSRAEAWVPVVRGWLRHVEEHPAAAARIHSTLGLHASRQGDFEEAIDRGRRAVALIEGAASERAWESDSSHSNLGVILSRAGRPREAIEVLEEVHRGLVERFGEDHPNVADVLERLGIYYEDVGRYDDGLATLELAVSLREEHPGDALALGKTISALSNVYFSLARDEDAYAAGARALDEVQRVVSGDHPVTSVLLNNLGNFADRLGRKQEAIDSYERALAMRRRLGDDPGELIAPLTNLATTYADTDQLRERGLPLIEEAWVLARAELPAGHPMAAFVRAIFGQLLQRDGRSAEALVHLEGALVDLEAKLEPHAEIIVESRLYLGAAQRSLGEHQTAMETLRRGLDGEEMRPDRRARGLFELARAQWALGLGEEARASATEAADELRRDGDSQTRLAEVEAWLASTEEGAADAGGG